MKCVFRVFIKEIKFSVCIIISFLYKSCQGNIRESIIDAVKAIISDVVDVPFNAAINVSIQWHNFKRDHFV